MAVDLSSIDKGDYDETEQATVTAIENVLTKSSSASADGTAKAVADALSSVCTARAAKGFDTEGVLELIWGVVIDVASAIPHDHPWHDSLAGSIDFLRQRGELEVGGGQKTSWEDLPGFAITMREKWLDPTFITDDKAATKDPTAREFWQWRNLNSFAAKVTARGYQPWMTLPFWQIRTALEEPPEGKFVMQCRLWVAGEWLYQCAKLLHEELTSGGVDERTAQMIGPGTLCGDVPPLSLKRWDFWKSQINADVGPPGNKDYQSDVIEKLSQALQQMTAVEGKTGA